jgi:hypothetical protein
VRIALVENKGSQDRRQWIEDGGLATASRRRISGPLDANPTAGRLRFNSGSLIHTPRATRGVSQGTEIAIYSISAERVVELDFLGRIRRASEAGALPGHGSAAVRRPAGGGRPDLLRRATPTRLEIARRTIERRGTCSSP